MVYSTQEKRMLKIATSFENWTTENGFRVLGLAVFIFGFVSSRADIIWLIR